MTSRFTKCFLSLFLGIAVFTGLSANLATVTEASPIHHVIYLDDAPPPPPPSHHHHHRNDPPPPPPPTTAPPPPPEYHPW